MSDLYFTMLQVGNHGIDPLYVGRAQHGAVGIALDRCLAFRQDPAGTRSSSTSASRQFQADPVAEIRKLYAWLGDELADETVERMLAWRADNPKDKYGRHEYDGPTSGSPRPPWTSDSPPTVSGSRPSSSRR